MTDISVPTTVLPPITRIQFCSPETLTEALSYLRNVYNPQVRGSRRIRRTREFPPTFEPTLDDCNVGFSAEDSEDLDIIRSDAFERSYSIRWLTSLCSCADFETNDLYKIVDFEAIVDEAAALLAVCAGTSAAGTLTRNFTFGQSGIQVRITDIPLENRDYSSVGAQTWGAACVLAEIIAESPEQFGLHTAPSNLRVLELGAGTGLVSLTLGKLMEARVQEMPCKATIIATDFHPSVLANLQNNIAANFPDVLSRIDPNDPNIGGSVLIQSHFLDWSQLSSDSDMALEPALDRPFDLILGADIAYEREFAGWVKSCVHKLLRKPSLSGISDSPHNYPSRFHLIIPLRPTHTLESGTIEEVYPFAQNEVCDCSLSEDKLELAIISKDMIVCDAHGDRRHQMDRDEVEYAYYTIGWVTRR